MRTCLCLSKETERTCLLRSWVTEPYDSTLPSPGYWASKDTQLPLCERNKPTVRQAGHHSKSPREIWIQMSKNTHYSIFNLILRGANKARANLCSCKHVVTLHKIKPRIKSKHLIVQRCCYFVEHLYGIVKIWQKVPSAICIEDFNLIKIKRELGFSVVALETVAESLGPSEECSTRVCTCDLHRTHPEHVLLSSGIVC